MIRNNLHIDKGIGLSYNETGFTPNDVSSLHAWWSADQADVSGDKVISLHDRSGNGRDMTQTAGSNQPDYIADGGADFNNRPVMRFDGVNHFMQTPDFDYGDYTRLNVWVAAKVTDISVTRTLISHRDVANFAWNFRIFVPGKVNIAISDTGTGAGKKIAASLITILTTQPYLISFDYNVNTLILYVDSVNTTNLTTNNPMLNFFNSTTAIRLGVNGSAGDTVIQYFKGDIAEVIITGATTAIERSYIDNYLMEKYGI